MLKLRKKPAPLLIFAIRIALGSAGEMKTLTICSPGTDLSGYTQELLDPIAYELNIRPRQRFNYHCPIEIITDVVLSEQTMLGSIQ